VTAQSDSRPTKAEIEAALPAFVGEIEQTPPKYSAIKVDGARAYDLARDGQDVELAARTVRVDALNLVEIPSADTAKFELRCGKGTYVRAIARDLGEKFGCFGHVIELRRTIVGPFDENDAISLDMLEELRHKDALVEALKIVETALVDIPALAITKAEANRLQCGQSLRVPSKTEGTVYVTSQQDLVAIAQLENGELRPVRVFNL
jgi:tRNA pseudouridine55 synthase